METKFRKAAATVVDKVFPVSKSSRDSVQQQLIKSGNEYMTNLPLQMLLYFNVFFFPFWFIVSVVMLEAKYTCLSDLYKIINIAVLIVMTILEVVRLYLGYLGNLTEKVPDLAVFWLMTLLLQTPLALLVLFNEATVITPLERAMHIVQCLFILFEVIIGYIAVSAMVNYQVTKFHLQQFSDLDQVAGHNSGYQGFENLAYVPDTKFTQ